MNETSPSRTPAAVEWWHRVPGDVRTAALATSTVVGALALSDARPAPLRATGPRPFVDAISGLVPASHEALAMAISIAAAFATLVLLHRVARTAALPAVADRAVWLAALTTLPGAALGDPMLVLGTAATLGSALLLHRDRPIAAALTLSASILLAAPGAAALVFGVVAVARPRGPRLRSMHAAAVMAVPVLVLAGLVAWDVHSTGATAHLSLAAIALGPGTPVLPWQAAVDAVSGTFDLPALFALVVAAALLVGPRRFTAARLHGVALALAVAAGLVAGPVALVAAPIVVLVAATALDRWPGLERPVLVLLALWLVH